MDIIKTIKDHMVPVHPAGYPFVLAFGFGAILLFQVWDPLGWLGVILTGWCAFFFRDPPRVVPTMKGVVVSPADGVVVSTGQTEPPEELGLKGKHNRISIFLNIFDVHVNRVPATGQVDSVCYTAGEFLNAELDKASEKNERMAIAMTTEDETKIGFVQIAGLVARRIVCELGEGQKVEVGERFGLIRFGSRVDVYLPEKVKPQVALGQRVIAGESILARLSGQQRKYDVAEK